MIAIDEAAETLTEEADDALYDGVLKSLLATVKFKALLAETKSDIEKTKQQIGPA